MLIRRYVTALGLLLVLGFLITRCSSQYISHVWFLTSEVKQAPAIYQKLVAIGASSQDMQTDNNGDPTQETLQNKDINKLYDITKTLRNTVNIAIPTNLAANLPFNHFSAIHPYAQKAENGFQSGMETLIDRMRNLMGSSKLQKDQLQQNQSQQDQTVASSAPADSLQTF